MEIPRFTRAQALAGVGATLIAPAAAAAQSEDSGDVPGVHIRTLRAVGGTGTAPYEVALYLDALPGGIVRISQLGDVQTPADLSFVTGDSKIVFTDPKTGATIGVINIPLKIISLRVRATSTKQGASASALDFGIVGNYDDAFQVVRASGLHAESMTFAVLKAQRDIGIGQPAAAVSQLMKFSDLDDGGKRILADAFTLSGDPERASAIYGSLSAPLTSQPWLSSSTAAKYKAVVDQFGVVHASDLYDDALRVAKTVTNAIQSPPIIPQASLYTLRTIFGSIPQQYRDNLFRFLSCFREFKTFEPSGAIGRLSVRFSYLLPGSAYQLEFALAQRDAGTTQWIAAVNQDVLDHGAAIADSIADAFRSALS